MLSLPRPVTAADEDKALTRLCRKALWLPHARSWLAAYADYRRRRGNPWLLTPASFTPDVSKEQRALYDTRRRQGTLARIRRAIHLRCCAMCGSHHNGTLDHYLSREQYPEFSILPCNLVPACSLCNSGAKGRSVRGTARSERFFHPYFDRHANDPLWRVAIVPPYGAATFDPVPLPGLGAGLRSRVDFHLKNILGEQFAEYIETQWALLPEALRQDTGPTPTTRDVRRELRNSLRRDSITGGVNGWRSALLRGVLADSGAVANIRDRIHSM